MMGYINSEKGDEWNQGTLTFTLGNMLVGII